MSSIISLLNFPMGQGSMMTALRSCQAGAAVHVFSLQRLIDQEQAYTQAGIASLPTAVHSLTKFRMPARRYVYNKIDVCSIEEVDAIARMPASIPCSASQQLNMDGLLERMWDMMALVRVYTKRVRACLSVSKLPVLACPRTASWSACGTSAIMSHMRCKMPVLHAHAGHCITVKVT